MRSSNKLTAMVLALAICSTMSVATAFAESEETTTAPATSETIATTEADGGNSEITETTPETPSNVEVFGDVTIKIENGGSRIVMSDSSKSAVFENGNVTIDGTVLNNASPLIPDEKDDRVIEILDMIDKMNITSITFTDNVTEIHTTDFTLMDFTQANFGKNISYIADGAFSDYSLNSIHGYKGTAAEKYAQDNNIEFTALDLTEIPVSTTTAATNATTTVKNTTTTAASKKTTTASKATSTKKTTKASTTAKTTAATTKKSSTSPKTGDKGVGAAVGILGAAAVTIAAARKKKHE